LEKKLHSDYIVNYLTLTVDHSESFFCPDNGEQWRICFGNWNSRPCWFNPYLYGGIINLYECPSFEFDIWVIEKEEKRERERERILHEIYSVET